MRNIIRGYIKNIPKGSIFDSHAIIFKLIQSNSNEYLTNFTGNTTAIYHGTIGQIIAEFENDPNDRIKRIGNSWSKNIRDKFSKCTCWEKL